jgi:hypothetical protein
MHNGPMGEDKHTSQPIPLNTMAHRAEARARIVKGQFPVERTHCQVCGPGERRVDVVSHEVWSAMMDIMTGQRRG